MNGHFVPIGSQGFYRKAGEKARFDQQPVEACATVSACLEAYRATGDDHWRTQAWSAFNWFLGDNDLKTALYDAATGGCRDGLHPDRANENQGAESTLSFLMALLEMRQLQDVQVPELQSSWLLAQFESFCTPASSECQFPATVNVTMTLTIDIVDSTDSLLHRHPANPILSSKDWPYRINSVFNAGATLLADGSTLLLCRVEDRRGLSHLCTARSVNGVDGWKIDPKPTLMPDPNQYPEELWGIEDPRITYVPELQQYAVAYTSYSKGGPWSFSRADQGFSKL